MTIAPHTSHPPTPTSSGDGDAEDGPVADASTIDWDAVRAACTGRSRGPDWLALRYTTDAVDWVAVELAYAGRAVHLWPVEENAAITVMVASGVSDKEIARRTRLPETTVESRRRRQHHHAPSAAHYQAGAA